MSRTSQQRSHKDRRAQLNALMRRFNAQCYWCRRPVIRVPAAWNEPLLPFFATRDHLLSRVDGGAARSENLVLACHECNNERGCMDDAAWIRKLGQIGPGGDPVTAPPPEAEP
jgi:5-methylcytosine-specific restriction endonuclease McrA